MLAESLARRWYPTSAADDLDMPRPMRTFLGRSIMTKGPASSVQQRKSKHQDPTTMCE